MIFSKRAEYTWPCLQILFNVHAEWLDSSPHFLALHGGMEFVVLLFELFCRSWVVSKFSEGFVAN